MRTFETLGEYHDYWSLVLLSAPDNFRDVKLGLAPAADQQQALASAFGHLRSGFHFVHKKLKNERLARVIEELIEMSSAAYAAGDSKSGAHLLQEAEGLIWPSRRAGIKHAVEAERRAFGENVLYRDVVVSPYPYEGSSSDLSPEQMELLHLAERWCRTYQAQQRDFKYFSWVLDSAGAVRRTSSEPKEDHHAILPPAQRLLGHKRLRELGHTGAIQACVLMEIVGPLGSGIVNYELEQRGRPRLSARQIFNRGAGGITYEPMRFHLEDPQFFPDVTPPP